MADERTERHFAEAMRHVEEGERRVAEQRLRIAQLQHAGHDTGQSRRFLQLLLHTLGLMRAHLAMLEREKAQQKT